MYDTEDDDVAICGCPNGSDVFVHHDGQGKVRLTLANGKSHVVAYDDRRQAIIEFSDAARSFYDRSHPKNPADDTDSAGFAKLLAEWDRRRSKEV